jgi:hypothetical protein
MDRHRAPPQAKKSEDSTLRRINLWVRQHPWRFQVVQSLVLGAIIFAFALFDRQRGALFAIGLGLLFATGWLALWAGLDWLGITRRAGLDWPRTTRRAGNQRSGIRRSIRDRREMRRG